METTIAAMAASIRRAADNFVDSQSTQLQSKAINFQQHLATDSIESSLQTPISSPRRLKNLREVIPPYGDAAPYDDLFGIGIKSEFPSRNLASRIS